MRDGPGATQGHYPDIPTAMPFCPVGSQLLAVIDAPSCWDGKNLDTPDHRAHMSYGTPETGGQKCPADHPYAIPSWQTHVQYLTDANFAAGKWHLSSDEMMPGVAPGTTLHMDYFEAWSPTVKATWQKECIDRHATCSGGDLGNGTRIKEIDHTPKHELVALSSIP